MINQVLLVGAGGAIGSIARWLCQKWMSYQFPHAFPLGTFAVNITGCLLIGIFWGLYFRSAENWRLFLMTGFCGGFTTFSAFTLEGLGLLKENKTGLFFLYIGGSVIAGLLATYLGMKLVK